MKKDDIKNIKSKAVNMLNTGYKEEQNSYKHEKKGECEIAKIEAESSQYHIGLAYGIKICLMELGYDITELQKIFSDLQQAETLWRKNFVNENSFLNDNEYEK